ncbi:MAG TPA: glucose-6-phosphate dehydrogenase [Polyangia bacterium]|jgi:glucose-6-phosphate 1-dehydrogenase
MRPADPSLIVILGGAGDLSRRMLIPALARLAREGLLGERYAILGVGTAPRTDAAFRGIAREALRAAGLPFEATRLCEACFYYQQVRGMEGYRALRARIEEVERAHGLPGNRVFYLALPPEKFHESVVGLGEVGLARSPGFTRIVIEKPFGRDAASAAELNRELHARFDESQIYRIDHYLGKETTRNLLVFRFANPIFESVWNRSHIESVQITVAEKLGVEQRAGYYDTIGGLRDMVQNHLTQLVCLIGMEVPGALDAEAIRYEKVKVLRCAVPPADGDVVLGQYGRGRIDGAEVPAYREEPGIAPDSTTDTFAALRLTLDSWRWQGVPFFLRTGKRLPARLTQICVNFRRPPVWLFKGDGQPELHRNRLVMRLQPDEGFQLYFDVKTPGEGMVLKTLPLHFEYKEAFGELPPAYQTLVYDVLLGDQTLFVDARWTEASWRLYQPLLEHRLPVYNYPAGSWGPAEAEELLSCKGERWEKW